MEHFFADTSFLVARFNPRDAHHRDVQRTLGAGGSPVVPGSRWILSDYVFDETITTVLSLTKRHDIAQKVGEVIRSSHLMSMVRVDEAAFEQAWSLFCERSDKKWSFTDCTSFVLMERLGLRKALSFDHSFREAGFATFP